MLYGGGVVWADLDRRLRALHRHDDINPLAFLQFWASFSERDGGVVGAVGREGAEAGAIGTADEAEDVAMFSVGGEDDAFRSIDAVGKAHLSILMRQIVEDDRPVVFELLVEFVILRAGGGVVCKLPFTTGGASLGLLWAGEVIFEWEALLRIQQHGGEGDEREAKWAQVHRVL